MLLSRQTGLPHCCWIPDRSSLKLLGPLSCVGNYRSMHSAQYQNLVISYRGWQTSLFLESRSLTGCCWKNVESLPFHSDRFKPHPKDIILQTWDWQSADLERRRLEHGLCTYIDYRALVIMDGSYPFAGPSCLCLYSRPIALSSALARRRSMVHEGLDLEDMLHRSKVIMYTVSGVNCSSENEGCFLNYPIWYVL